MSVQPPAARTRWVNPIIADLRSRRLESGITQVDLARRMRRDPQCLCDWEVGKQEPNLRNLQNWCAALGLHLAAVNRE